MIEGTRIMRHLRKQQSLFANPLTPSDVVHIIQQALKPWGVKVSYEQSSQVPLHSFSVGGAFDSERIRQNIELQVFFASRQRKLRMSDTDIENLLFLCGQVLQHELIHRYQNAARPADAKRVSLYFDIQTRKSSLKEEIDYLSELDEIDAYAHDIALEIYYYYPDQDPYDILRTLHKRRKLTSWNMYKHAFKYSDEWHEVRRRLLGKVYAWIPHITL